MNSVREKMTSIYRARSESPGPRPPPNSQTTPGPEFVAVILAATHGTNLYPLTIGKDNQDYFNNMSDDKLQQDEGGLSPSTDKYLPKHLLPLAGKPLIHHLINQLIEATLEIIIVAIASEDNVTIPCLIEMGAKRNQNDNWKQIDFVEFFIIQNIALKVVKLPSDCGGSADALRFISSMKQKQEKQQLGGEEGKDVDEKDNIIPSQSHVMVLPGDLVLYGNLYDDGENAIGTLADVHRRNCHLGMIKEGPPLALTVLLTDVGEKDENGLPLKESAKAKKGGMAREDAHIEIIGLSEIRTSRISSSSYFPNAQRIILKESKYNIENDDDNVGESPKLTIPKVRLHSPMNQILIRTDWNDVHLLCFSPWVLKLIEAKTQLKDLSKEVVALLVEGQFKGVKACFGIKKNSADEKEKKDNDDKKLILGQILNEAPFGHQKESNDSIIESSKEYPFLVLAHVLQHESSKLVLRARTVPSYMYVCKELVTQALMDSKSTSKSRVSFLDGATVDVAKNSITLPNSSLGDKVQIRSSTIGKNVTVGNRCRLNNVVVMDNVNIGDDCILQNSVLSTNCSVDHCNLNECQVAPNHAVPRGTKGKGESYSG